MSMAAWGSARPWRAFRCGPRPCHRLRGPAEVRQRWRWIRSHAPRGARSAGVDRPGMDATRMCGVVSVPSRRPGGGWPGGALCGHRGAALPRLKASPAETRQTAAAAGSSLPLSPSRCTGRIERAGARRLPACPPPRGCLCLRGLRSVQAKCSFRLSAPREVLGNRLSRTWILSAEAACVSRLRRRIHSPFWSGRFVLHSLGPTRAPLPAPFHLDIVWMRRARCNAAPRGTHQDGVGAAAGLRSRVSATSGAVYLCRQLATRLY